MNNLLENNVQGNNTGEYYALDNNVGRNNMANLTSTNSTNIDLNVCGWKMLK